MQIRRFFLLKSLIVVGVVGVFTNIYQQNNIIKLRYEKQRLEQRYQQLLKKKNALLVACAQAKNYDELRNKAMQDYGMTQLPLSRLITFTGVVTTTGSVS